MARLPCSNKHEYLLGLLEQIETLRKTDISYVYRMGAAITVEVMLFVKDYFSARPAEYDIDIHPCNTCTNQYDIIITLKKG